MSYDKHNWLTGEIITANRLNNIEEGIANPDTVIIDEYVNNWLDTHPEAIVIGDETITKDKLNNEIKEELNNIIQNTENITILQENLGVLTGLLTEEQTNLVEAINEIKREIDNINNKILTTDIKNALLQIADKIIYTDENGSNYYNTLYNALYPSTGEE